MMECNKEEALRAKNIAEKKMQSNDFEGARKIAMKAQQLFPELENISQLLTVCSVHCAAQNKILGSEKDLYGILQLDKFADDVAVKKQYRKLALTLHPDKNKLPGAEAAFKLIGEANAVLLDPGKKGIYDSKCKVSLRTAQAKPPSKQFCSVNRNQTTTSNTSALQATFWTACPYCNTKFQYLKKFVNHVLPCQSCIKTFTAYELSIPGASFIPVNLGKPHPKTMHPGKAGAYGASQPPTQGIPHTGSSRMTMPTTSGNSASHTGSQGSKQNRTARSKSGSATDGGKEKSENRDANNLNSVKMDKHKARESKIMRNGRKRNRKQVVESSDSCDTSSSDGSDEYVMEEDGATYTAGLDSGGDSVRCTRRSFRRRQNVSYNENGSDDDLEEIEENGNHKSDQSKCSGDNEVKETAVRNNAFKPSSTSEVNTNSMGHVPGGVEIIDDSKSDHDPDSTTEQQVYETLDPEFTDFDKEKERHCFAVNQIWALYDSMDGMPRFYAMIKKVFKIGFKLDINWLEGYPDDESEITWVNQELPYGCGRFRFGESERTTDKLSFSHRVQYGAGLNKASVVIHPQKGEVWALFKDWDIKWSSNPEKHKKFKYEIVEVVSDFSEEAGIRVSYLDKVKGFICLFQRANTPEMDFRLIPANEMLRFSHRIPSSKMTGTERDGVSVGSFELDPASLPLDLVG